MPRVMRLRLYFSVVAPPLAAAIVLSTVQGATRTWDGGGGADNDWRTDANWSSNLEPGSADTAQFTSAANVEAGLFGQDNDISTDRLRVRANVTLGPPPLQNGADYLVVETDTVEGTRGVIIGELNGDVATLNMNLPLLSTAAATIGYFAGATGTLNLAGGDQLDVTGSDPSNHELIVGGAGTGTLSVSGGADVDVFGLNSNSIIGEYTGSTGTATVTGGGSTWANSRELWVGYQGAATLNVLAGGAVDNSDAYLAAFSGSSGTATVDGAGSTWTSRGNLYVGNLDDGALDVTGGGVVADANGYIGTFAGGVGEVNVGGTGSAWNNSSALYIGNLGDGTLNVTDGGQVTAQLASYIGNQTGSIGAATVSGTGSKWTTAGPLYVGNQGDGTLTIQNAGTVETTGALSINNLSAVNLQSGLLKVGSLSGGANLNWTGGTLHVSGSDVVVDTGGTLGSSVTIGAAQSLIADISNGVHSIGLTGMGALTVNGGAVQFSKGTLVVGNMDGAVGSVYLTSGVVTTDALTIGLEPGASGDVEIDGSASSWTSDNVRVGDGGVGEVKIQNGAHAAWRLATLGVEEGSSGEVRVDGMGSMLSASAFRVGEAGSGALTVSRGAAVNSIGTFYLDSLGREAGSSGVVTIQDEGSQWTAAGIIEVGRSGLGTLLINGGGSVDAVGDIWIGSGSQGEGEIVVDGVGSTLATGDILMAGLSGWGALRITGGAASTAAFSRIGNLDGSHGEVHVNGDGSAWTVNGSLKIGVEGSGLLSVSNGAAVESATCQVGNSNTSMGSVTVEGMGSTWTCNGSLDVGFDNLVSPSGDGPGSVLITDNATVSAATWTIHRKGTLTVLEQGEAATNDNLISFGEIAGNGTVNADVFNYGRVSPSGSPAALFIDGDFNQLSDGELRIELTSDQVYDRLIVDGDVALNGKLTLELIGGFVPSANAEFDILDFDGLSGAFSMLALPSLSGFLSWDVSQLYTTGKLQVIGTPYEGDFQEDLDVDSLDLTLWRGGFGGAVNSHIMGNADRDADVDGADFLAWQRQYGAGVMPPTGVVPEPASAGLLSLAVAAGSCSLRRRRMAA